MAIQRVPPGPDYLAVMSIAIGAFVLIFTSPFWLSFAMANRAGFAPWEEPEIASGAGTECILDSAEMRYEHMEILDDWRDEAIREGHRNRTAESLERGGRFRAKSLSNTCLGCHTDREAFCDRCHDYAGETPYCWDCHVDSTTTGQQIAPAAEAAERREP